jgi:hypothetical protein
MPNYKLPYDGSPPIPGSGTAYAVGVVLLDPATGLPVAPATSGPPSPGSAGPGISSRNSVGTAGTEVIAAAGAFKSWVTVQNTHAANTLYLSFETPALATDFALQPGEALTLPVSFNNALYGRGSAAGTTFAAIGV